jgi:hypothetical protein
MPHVNYVELYWDLRPEIRSAGNPRTFFFPFFFSRGFPRTPNIINMATFATNQPMGPHASADTPRSRKRKQQGILLELQPPGSPSVRAAHAAHTAAAAAAAGHDIENASPSTSPRACDAAAPASTPDAAVTVLLQAPPPAPAAPPAAARLEVDAAGDPRATKEDAVHVLDSAGYDPSTDAVAERSRMLADITSPHWSVSYHATESFRRLCIHHHELVAQDL